MQLSNCKQIFKEIYSLLCQFYTPFWSISSPLFLTTIAASFRKTMGDLVITELYAYLLAHGVACSYTEAHFGMCEVLKAIKLNTQHSLLHSSSPSCLRNLLLPRDQLSLWFCSTHAFMWWLMWFHSTCAEHCRGPGFNSQWLLAFLLSVSTQPLLLLLHWQQQIMLLLHW